MKQLPPENNESLSKLKIVVLLTILSSDNDSMPTIYFHVFMMVVLAIFCDVVLRHEKA